MTVLNGEILEEDNKGLRTENPQLKKELQRFGGLTSIGPVCRAGWGKGGSARQRFRPPLQQGYAGPSARRIEEDTRHHGVALEKLATNESIMATTVNQPIYGAVTSTDKASEYRIYFAKKLLEHQVDKLQLYDYCLPGGNPNGSGF